MIRLILIIFISFTSALFAQNEPLNVGIENFDPPFIVQGSNHEIYGFDIEMMNNLCKIMHRTCTYQVMPFEQLLAAVANKKIDAAIGSISITTERKKIVMFSLPYLLSYSRFLATQSHPNEVFSLALLDNKKIGIEKATIFRQQLNEMGVQNATITEYASTEDELNALKNGKLDYVLLDNATALFWVSNTSNIFKMIGPPLRYGYGYGIALNASEPNLVNSINEALLQYQNSEEYTENYRRYFSEF
jgi:polar amino acid transport system substrate-binding protein